MIILLYWCILKCKLFFISSPIMMFHINDLHLGKNLSHNITAKILLLSLVLILVPMISLYILNNSLLVWLSPKGIESLRFGKKCDIFRGKWIWYPNKTYYTNATCRKIFDHQNCMKFGRPDADFLKWRWKPDGCELPFFDAMQFLELLRGKSMAFVGDSLGRNQVESLLCLLTSVVHPEDINSTTDSNVKRWLYVNYNFTLASFWSPYLVKSIDTDLNASNYNRQTNLYLDEVNDAWAAQIEEFDYVIISAGRWFYGPKIFYENSKVVGCHFCLKNSITNLTMFYGYKKAFRTSFKTFMSLKGFNGVIFLRTLSPAHFENGEWNKGGNCIRKQPVSRGEIKWHGEDLGLYLTQVKEFRRAEREGMKRGLKFRLLDISEAMVMRPDGHPNHYGHWPHENVAIADCVHWCLPGPIDTWNDFLLQMFKTNK